MGFQLKGSHTILLTHVLPLDMQEEPESSMQNASGECHAECTWGSLSLWPGGALLYWVPLTAEVLACGDKEGERFSSKFRSQEDALSTVGVTKSGQYIVAKLLGIWCWCILDHLPPCVPCTLDIIWIFGDLVVVQVITVDDFQYH
ncbi:hypothetical protein GRJ2_003338800 [Grus japonensis]|uniref:Uncharacterized protein n=1 Tax=Grus japonensis TaxID=30415 RepID=A0ABC9YFS7_GRUJA